MTTTPPLDWRVDIAPDASPDGDPALWSWLDVGAYRRQAADVTLNTGRDDESSTVEAADSSLVLNLRDGLLSPRNPYSTLYNRIGTNTPVRYRLNVFSDDFSNRTQASSLGTSSSGNVWVSGSRYSVSGGVGIATMATANLAAEAYVSDAGAADIDFVYSVSIPVITTGGPWISAVQVRRVSADTFYRVHTELKPAGEVYLKIDELISGSTRTLIDKANVATYTAGGKVWTRIQAIGGTIRVRSWVGTLGAEPSTWAVTTDDAANVEGVGFGFYQWRFGANTNAGSLAASLDDVVVQAFMWSGSVPEWSPRWDKSGNNATTTISPAGPLRLLGQGDDPLKSPLARQLPRYNPSDYWTGEDGSNATALGSATSAGRAATVNDVAFGTDDAPGGASASFTMNSAASFVRGRMAGNTTASFAALLFVKFSAIPPGTNTLVEWRNSTGTLRRFVVTFDGVAFGLSIYKDDGTLAASNTAIYVDIPTAWTAIRLEVVQSGGNINYQLQWHGVDKELFYSISGTVAGTSAKLSEFLIPASAAMAGTEICHIWVGPAGFPFTDSGFYLVMRGYPGELAADRIKRLCAEQGVRLALKAGTSEAMGRQRSAKFLDLLRECAEADMGILYERAFGLGYIPRSARYNPATALTIDWSAGGFAEAPQPTDDDQRLRNRWTVSRVGGSEAVYQNDVSVAKSGTVRDSAEINIQTDRRLLWHAMFRTALTTIDELRWPVLDLDLIAHPEYIPFVLGLRPGKRVRVTNPKDQVAGITIDLIVEGVKHEFGRHRWDVALSCSPASPWLPSTWGTGLWNASTTTVQSAVAAGVTSFNITTASRWEIWSTTASGYQWDLAGETVTVNSVGAASGTGPYVQPVTVTRAVNGVSKTIPAGTKPRMLAGAKWAL